MIQTCIQNADKTAKSSKDSAFTTTSGKDLNANFSWSRTTQHKLALELKASHHLRKGNGGEALSGAPHRTAGPFLRYLGCKRPSRTAPTGEAAPQLPVPVGAVPAPQPSARRLKPFLHPCPGSRAGGSGEGPGQRTLSSRRHFPSAPQRGVSHPDCAFTGRAATAQPDRRGAEPCPVPGALTALGAGAKPAAERDRCSQLGGGSDPRSGPGPGWGERQRSGEPRTAYSTAAQSVRGWRG